MARYNEILTGRFNRALTKLLSMKGDAVAPQLAGEIQPGFVFPVGAEFRYLEQWNRFSFASAASEVGGVTAAKARLRNPANSNVVGVVERLVVATSVAADVLLFTLGPIAGDLTVVGTPQRLDARITAASGVLIPSLATSGGVDSPQIGQYISGAVNTMYEQIFDEIQEITILPGDGLGVSMASVAAGTVLRFWFIWRERFLEESERA